MRVANVAMARSSSKRIAMPEGLWRSEGLSFALVQATLPSTSSVSLRCGTRNRSRSGVPGGWGSLVSTNTPPRTQADDVVRPRVSIDHVVDGNPPGRPLVATGGASVIRLHVSLLFSTSREKDFEPRRAPRHASDRDPPGNARRAESDRIPGRGREPRVPSTPKPPRRGRREVPPQSHRVRARAPCAAARLARPKSRCWRSRWVSSEPGLA